MSIRKFMAIAALANAMVALYLHLWKLGLTGSLACTGAGGCAYVQGSRYGWFLGVDVALIGAIGYTLIFLTAVVGSLPQFEDVKWPNQALQVLVWPAVLFTVRLKYGEFVVLKGFCPWCAVSAVTMVVFAVLVILDAKRLREPQPLPA
ncbi:MAG TPA: hypothetical protein DGD08_07120 [Gemmatimonas aurantiaca]|uniref:Vitamin K epoxide reductase domain-containing protein n=2 Tax=Gemmatimonas aurantiaca TaxID=173480 RepID=A0A3D4V795_9BACT|nr:vitamin K epoxide reductase family protein [Gemmatimonas aurantiaca]BAH38197.1 hypothetical membrane protein [Gemmatimonas aurantiaca T-27]HCT56971.1 hypothetical protein [Gemmatimonas aurantiaca]